MLLPLQGAEGRCLIPGVPLRSAPGYVLVAPLGRVLSWNVLSGGWYSLILLTNLILPINLIDYNLKPQFRKCPLASPRRILQKAETVLRNGIFVMKNAIWILRFIDLTHVNGCIGTANSPIFQEACCFFCRQRHTSLLPAAQYRGTAKHPAPLYSRVMRRMPVMCLPQPHT